jgi:endonuclease YncB( thermonuclease family)
MFLASRLLSAKLSGAGIALAGAAFVVGLGLGSTAIAPGNADRGTEPSLTQSAPVRAEATPAALRAAHPAEVLRVLDGDTFEARVHLWPGLDITTRVRLRGIDAPEFKARCIEERMKAETSRDALKAILDQGEVGITRVALDKYGGRVIADASTRATPDVSAALIEAGLARRYGGARRESWCS